ncbi:AraC family transcriptional regulator [Paenibacillus caseinilyticus]|uniref:AraC family transcriptional regulator n=1 Tax=Paenibacillus mucilaginosus K02 TaxID=997761 RepID=I0BFN3_9BACL|nr:AraC family transcriptional regulator [Paenibacillus mucilaginosus]AFH61180.1 AraC family transcriptional regulator [Paenibacillus mucilaginosus K02]
MRGKLNMGYNYNSLRTSFDFAYQSTTTLEDWHIFHMHEGMEFLYVHEGRGYAIIDQKIVEMGPRTLVYFQPFQLHGTKVYLDQSSVYTRSILSFEPSELNAYLQLYPALKAFFHSLWKTKQAAQIISELPANNPLESMFEHYHRTLNTCSPSELKEEYILFIIGFLQYVKSIWPQQKVDEDQLAAASPSYMERIMTWIEENYTNEFHLEDLSKELHLSPYYIAHLFHNSTGSNISQYLTARRMRQACWLLKNSTLSIQQICQQVGLTNVSYFCKKFKEFTGRTPLKYRIGGAQ